MFFLTFLIDKQQMDLCHQVDSFNFLHQTTAHFKNTKRGQTYYAVAFQIFHLYFLNCTFSHPRIIFWRMPHEIMNVVKFIYSEKNTKIWRNLQILFEITLQGLEISSYFLAFSENMNFITTSEGLTPLWK